MVTNETELRRLTISTLVSAALALLAVVIVLVLTALGPPDGPCRGAKFAVSRLDGASNCVGDAPGAVARALPALRCPAAALGGASADKVALHLAEDRMGPSAALP
jgi:hypothetical protein